MRTAWGLSLAVAFLGGNLALGQASSSSASPAGPSSASVLPPEPLAGSNYHPTSISSPAGQPAEFPAPVAGTVPAASGAANCPGRGVGQPAWTDPAPCATERVWADAEYILWFVNGNRIFRVIGALPASLAGTELPPGAIRAIHYGRNDDTDLSSGGRLTLGGWLDDEQRIGLEGSFFALAKNTIHFGGASTGDPVVGPLFYDPTVGRETIITPVDPSQAFENAAVSMTQRLWGAEANFLTRVASVARSPFELLAGFRYLDLTNSLDTRSSATFIGFGNRTYADHFDTHNQFYGGQVGASFDLREGPWSVKVTGKVALGGVQETFNIRGLTQETFGGSAPTTFVGGILAQKTNIGRFTHTQFACVPEATLNVGYNLTSYLRAFVGYNFLFMDNAMRPRDEIEAVNPRYVQGLIVQNPVNLVRPLPTFRSGELWAQGFNFGVELFW